jgi:dTDP-glucose pyrophosphorylase
VYLGRLTDDLEFVAKATGVSDVLLVVAEEVAQSVSYFLARCRRKRFVADHDKIYQAVHNGFAVALYVVEPDSADEFLKKSSAMFERVFEKSARNRRGQRVHQSKRNSSERS